jgi:hypothetical protein
LSFRAEPASTRYFSILLGPTARLAIAFDPYGPGKWQLILTGELGRKASLSLGAPPELLMSRDPFLGEKLNTAEVEQTLRALLAVVCDPYLGKTSHEKLDQLAHEGAVALILYSIPVGKVLGPGNLKLTGDQRSAGIELLAGCELGRALVSAIVKRNCEPGIVSTSLPAPIHEALVEEAAARRVSPEELTKQIVSDYFAARLQIESNMTEMYELPRMEQRTSAKPAPAQG